MISEGKVKARAVEADLGTTNNGKEQIAVCFRILEGPDDGQHITWYGYFSDAAQQRTLESMRHCGWEGDDIAAINPQNMCGLDANEVQLVIEHDTYNGKTAAKVQWVNKTGAGGVALNSRMDDAQRRAFAARMKGAAIASRKAAGGNGNGAKAAAPAKPRTAPGPMPRPTGQRGDAYEDDDPGPQDEDLGF